jgi:glycine dehydrogenase
MAGIVSVLDRFANRHIGPTPDERDAMLEAIGASSLDALIDDAIPAAIRLDAPLKLPPAETEYAFLRRLTYVARANRPFRSYIGLGYHDTFTPSVIRRMVLENPGWYTPYTPYQAEIAQGRLESLLNFQTMVTDLTAMEVANASLLDEATAAAEAMTLLRRVHKPSGGREARVFLASDRCFPQTLEVLRSRAEPLGIELKVVSMNQMVLAPDVFGVLLQYPDERGELQDLTPFISSAHEKGVLVAVGTDLLALALFKPPGEMGADVVVGNSQRFGVPLGYGGPHAAFFATRNAYVRQMPGRLIGVSVDADGHTAYRMALATREQHIRREKATSNICTAQALLANMAALYAVYHGPAGLRGIAARVHGAALALAAALDAVGIKQQNTRFFDTLCISVAGGVEGVRSRALEQGINFRYIDGVTVGISLNETTTVDDLTEMDATPLPGQTYAVRPHF